MQTISKIYLYVYGDSTIFPRKSQSLEDTWPYLLKDNLEACFCTSVYLAVRGLGGAAISEIDKILVVIQAIMLLKVKLLVFLL